jgi:hypothetical protein
MGGKWTFRLIASASHPVSTEISISAVLKATLILDR